MLKINNHLPGQLQSGENNIVSVTKKADSPSSRNKGLRYAVDLHKKQTERKNKAKSESEQADPIPSLKQGKCCVVM